MGMSKQDISFLPWEFKDFCGSLRFKAERLVTCHPDTEQRYQSYIQKLRT